MKKIRILIAVLGMDQHEVGAVAVSRLLRDAGMEIIYLGRFNTPAGIIKTSIEEDADVIGMSIYSGAHLPLGRKLMDQLREKGISDKLVLIGGNIPQRDINTLKDYGVSGVFPTGARLEEIVKFIRENVKN